MFKNQKRVFIIHGWGGWPGEGWLPWLKKELRKRRFKVYVPKMPNTNEPKISEWVGYLKKIIGDAGENAYFIGHSMGAQAIIRYLETLPQDTKVGGVIFVAGWTSLTNLDPEEKPIARPWIKTKISFPKVKKSAKKFVAVFSDNDLYVPLRENTKVFKTKLDAKIIIEHKKGHFSGSDGVRKLPVVLKELLKMAKL